MRGALTTKSKVIFSIQPKSQILKRKIKQERSSTPQRWSRRIRSLPPIPISDLKTNTNVKYEKSCSGDIPTVMKMLSNHKKETLKTVSRKNIFINKSVCPNDPESVEIVRVIPVIVYVKNNKPQFKALTEDIDVAVRERSPRNFNKTLQDDIIQRKIKQECDLLEKKWSKKIKMLAPKSLSFLNL